MQTVSVTEFRGNIKKYLELAENEKLVIHRNKGVSFVLTPLKDEDEDCLLSDAQKRAIDKGLEAVAQGRVMSNAEARKKINEKYPNFFK
ncbi:type II toxin-antitoxin system Phd/YefM family antitoxin [Flavobacterium gawalongense]|uniref:Antitoxin n=1 Tax=Flavobacterium gawalongense TaxID=2594432 RepID=A0ABY3CEW8_9FLAO|nr:type II toxin-antitoxin system Phd/YefM family antitoxin [Flavobacterium gawalongense]TRX01664.1 type II toxin-antitoxin system Phd/YefM family antitoxin [Flavobacterium gawalongense]